MKSKEKVTNNFAICFKDAENKFSRDVGEYCQEFVDDYCQVTNDFGITEE